MPEGTSFLDIIEVTDADETVVSTPEEVAETDAVATEGDTTEPETLGILKEDEAPEGTDKPDLSTDPDLEKHPILKAKMAEFIANKEKGIDKFINEYNAEKKELVEFKEQYQPLADFYQQFEDPETVDEAFAKTCRSLAVTYNRPFGGWDANGNQVGTTTNDETPTEGASKYGLEYDTDDKVVDVAVQVITTKLEQLLDKRLGPLTQKHEQETKSQQLAQKAASALPSLKSEFEVSSEPWITAGMITEAQAKYPSLEPGEAFQLAYKKEIAAYIAKHSAASKPTVRNLPIGDMGGKTRADLKVGSSFGDILSAEATL